ncbi:hypothetical protein EG832_21300 [bacterium]|nr:hypothetical protein [bacterium]
MPDREEKHSILPSHHTDLKTQGLYAALDGLTSLNSTLLPLDSVANQISATTRSALKVPCVALWLVDDLHKHIALQAFACTDSTETNPRKYNISIEDESSPVATCVIEGKASLHKKQSLPEMDPRSNTLTKTYISAVLPLSTPSGIIGVFEILTSANDGLNNAELESLEVLAAQVSLLISYHQTSDHSVRQSALQKKLYEITSKINQAKDYESILQITVEELCTALNLPGASMQVNMSAVGKEHKP